MKGLMIGAMLAALAHPALAEESATTGPLTARAARPAAQLDAGQRENYRAVFQAIRDGKWSDASARLEAMGDGPLHPVALAELYLAKGSPTVSADQLSAILARGTDLPQAPRLVALLQRRGGDLAVPSLPQPRRLLPARGAPRRLAARSDRADAASARLAQQIRPFIKEDRAGEMEGYLLAAQEDLGPAGRTEWQQRIAWTYYLAGDDENALRLAITAGQGTGEFAAMADWVAGLAAWRQDRCEVAGKAFQSVASRARDDEMRAAGLFWSARADMACQHPERVQARLRTAARLPETFYGLLAARSLGITPPPPVQPAMMADTEWSAMAPHSNARAAIALAEIGETALAEDMLRWQARIGDPGEHLALTHLAAQLSLPGTQIYLAHNSPDGRQVDASARYPRPGWTPANGWQVDQNLIWAHSLEESVFRVSATSGAGARGLMGIMPGTAEQLDRREGLNGTGRARLADPAVNMAYGQRMLTWLRDLESTGGLLPKVIAAYNAGPGANIKWNPNLRDGGDPLLWIESIPYIETRAYVGLVLRNYWMYERQAGKPSTSQTALAQGMWPRFPGLAGQTAVRMEMPLKPPVRMAVVMPPSHRAPALPDDVAEDRAVMVADAAPAAPAAPVAVQASLPSAGAKAPTASARALASAAAAGEVVKDVARSLATPVVRAKALTPGAPGIDTMIGAILKEELPRARARVNAVTAKVKAARD